MSHLLVVSDAESGIEFFVACLGQLSVSASDYVHSILDAVSQATSAMQSIDETVEQVPSVEPIAIEGQTRSHCKALFLTCMNFCLLAAEVEKVTDISKHSADTKLQDVVSDCSNCLK